MARRKRGDGEAGTPIVPAGVFKATCLELMDEVARTGRDVVVTKHGRPVVRLSPATAQADSPWGFLQGTIVRHGDIVSADADEWAATGTDPLLATRRR